MLAAVKVDVPEFRSDEIRRDFYSVDHEFGPLVVYVISLISDSNHKSSTETPKHTCIKPTKELASASPPVSAQSKLQHQFESAAIDRAHDLGAVSEAVVNIEQELCNVADKLNSIAKLYKRSQCCSGISIPTLGLILAWPVLTQFVFMWYASRRQIQQTR
ncbi:hypothetical protein M8J75_014481 [Diaphorina citri]|nr:hypothetical protein M8J75_014481 [Diaphorina citri]